MRERRLERRPRQRGNHLGDGEAVLPLDLVEQREGVVLHRRVVRCQRRLYLVDPPANHLGVDVHQVDARDERRRGDKAILVDERLLEVALDLRQHRPREALDGLVGPLAEPERPLGTNW